MRKNSDSLFLSFAPFLTPFCCAVSTNECVFVISFFWPFILCFFVSLFLSLFHSFFLSFSLSVSLSLSFLPGWLIKDLNLNWNEWFSHGRKLKFAQNPNYFSFSYKGEGVSRQQWRPIHSSWLIGFLIVDAQWDDSHGNSISRIFFHCKYQQMCNDSQLININKKIFWIPLESFLTDF